MKLVTSASIAAESHPTKILMISVRNEMTINKMVEGKVQVAHTGVLEHGNVSQVSAMTGACNTMTVMMGELRATTLAGDRTVRLLRTTTTTADVSTILLTIAWSCTGVPKSNAKRSGAVISRK